MRTVSVPWAATDCILAVDAAPAANVPDWVTCPGKEWETITPEAAGIREAMGSWSGRARKQAGAVLWAGMLFLVLGAAAQAAPDMLPYDSSNPVIYDNDGAIESGFTDIYMMALASAGVIDLKGIITTGSYGEERRNPPFSEVADGDMVRERQEPIEKARRSGLRSLPDAVSGGSLSPKRPASGRIDDTIPYGSSGSRLILKEARVATPTDPLVVVMGGQAICVVDAYLQDNSIADKMVLAWIVGNKKADGSIDSREYNAGVDAWARGVPQLVCGGGAPQNSGLSAP